MQFTKDLYQHSLALLTDLYQLTMAYGYYKNHKAEQRGLFHLYFRKNPFQGGFTIASGLENVIDFINNFKYTNDDLKYLSSLRDKKDNPMFPDDFLRYISGLKFDCQVDAVEEGAIVFPQEPLIRVEGPMIQCQLLETPLLNLVNFQTLITTKAARMWLAAEGDPILEFGLRRAQGVDGGVSASRAAYIGGCSSTSNVLAGKLYDIPVSGTHAHSWIMSYDNELESFQAYGKSYPDNSIFLVDTYDSIKGVRNAIEAAKKLREQGSEMAGIRLDSGDLAYLSKQTRKMLDENGFHNAKIVASNDLDEHLIKSLKIQGAKIDLWGIGTKLATGYDQPALGGVYKLSAIQDENGKWEQKIKLSEQVAKINNPGKLQVKRFFNNGELQADMIFNEWDHENQNFTIIDPMDPTRRKKLNLNQFEARDLLVPIYREGQQVYQNPDINTIKTKVQEGLAQLHDGIKRFVNPHVYPVGLEEKLYNLKMELVMNLRESVKNS